MASIWLEPISHESHSYHSDPVKLRRPLLISEFRIAKPQSVLLHIEFLAKDLRSPSDELVSLEHIDRVDPTGNDYPVKLYEPILTNFIVIKGEFKSLTLCLEANEVAVNNSRVTIKASEEEAEILMISPLECHGLFQYWMSYEDSCISSVRYIYGDFSGPSAAVFSIWKSASESVNSLLNEVEALTSSITSSTGYLGNMEKLGGLLENIINFYHAGFDSTYSGLRKLADSKLPLSLVKIAISALEGNLHGLMEAKAALSVVSHLLEMPRLATLFLESSGLSHLLLLVTHPSASSQMILKILSTLHALISIPKNSAYFFDKDITQALDPKVVQLHFSFPKRPRKDEAKKPKLEEETLYKTGYQILLGLLNEKKSIKVVNGIKILLNKCGLYYSLMKLNSLSKLGESCIAIIETIRRNLKLQMLRSSSHAFPSVKHDLLAFLLLDSSNTLNNLQGSVQYLAQSILTNSLADWLIYTNFLPNLLSFFIFQTSTLEDYRIAFINISDILLMLIRSQGGFGYLAYSADAILGFISAFQGLLPNGSSEEAEFNLLEEEYLLSTITQEKIPSYANQLALILTAILKISEQLNLIKNGESHSGLNSLYAFVNTEDSGSIVSSALYQIFRFQPEILLWLVEQIDFSTENEKLKSFYILEILKAALLEDRSGELMLILGQEITEALSSANVSEELHELVEVLMDLLKPVSRLKSGNIEPLIQDILALTKVKKDRIESKAAFLVIGESCYPEFDLTALGDLSTKGSTILQLLPSFRLINLVLSCNKWTSIDLISSNFLPVLTNIISKTTQILHTLYIKPNNNDVFKILNSLQIKNGHLELLLPCLNIFNMILQQLLGIELMMYNNSPLLESILHLAALCEVSSVPDFTRAKISRMIKTTFVLWAQLPNFSEVYLPILFEHAFQYPFKKPAILAIISSIFEFFASSKDPSFYSKCVEWMAKPYAQPLLGPELVYYYMTQAQNAEGEHKTMSSFQVSYAKAKESGGSKYEIRNAWEYKKHLGLLMDREGSVIDKCFKTLFNSNNYEVHLGFIRILRCVLASNHPVAGKNVVDVLKKMLLDKNNFKAKAIFIVHALSDIPCGKALLIHEDLTEILISLIQKPELTRIILKVFENLFDIGIISNEDEQLIYSEDLPSINNTQLFLLEIRELLLFAIPGCDDVVMEDEEDSLYGEFTKQKPKINTVPWEVTLALLNALRVLSSNAIGKSLIICGHYPFKDIVGPLDFAGFVKRVIAGLQQPDWQENCLNLLGVFLGILKNTGTNMISAEALANLSAQLRNLSTSKANSQLQILAALSAKPEIQYIELPKPRDITSKFLQKSPDFVKIKEFYKTCKKNHQNQLVLGKRFGEKIQIKPIQFLTDLLPPPYPPQFRFKPEIKAVDWGSFLEPLQELVFVKVVERQKAFEEKMRKLLPPAGYVPSVQTEIMMPKAPIQSNNPMMSMQAVSNQYPPRNVIVASQSVLTDSEKNALNELTGLLQKKDRSHDPRLQLKIEQLLSEYPNLCNYLKS